MPLYEMPNSELAKIKQKAVETGLILELGVRGDDRAYLLRNIEVSHKIGSKLMRAVLDGDEPVSRTVETIQSLVDELKGFDIKLAIENHFRFTPAELAWIIETIDDVHVGVCLDPLNSISQLVGPEEVISTLAPYALSVHAKDAVTIRRGTGFHIVGCPIGEGIVNIRGMIESLTEHGKSPNIVVEGWMDRLENEAKTIEQEEDWVRQSITYLRSVV
jgi:sugar phosphate isomerase/epimerase